MTSVQAIPAKAAWKDMQVLFWLLLWISSTSCLKSSDPGLPPNVVKAIQETGHNRVELTKTIVHFLKQGDSSQLASAYFLIGNILPQYSVSYDLLNRSGDSIGFSVDDFPGGAAFLPAWQHFNDSLGGLRFKPSKFSRDCDTITADYLIQNIILAHQSRQLPWASHIESSIFQQYVLPYRIGNEPLEDWRGMLQNSLLPLIPDSIQNNRDKVAHFVNDHLNQLVTFDIRYVKVATPQPASLLISEKKGNHEAISQLKVKALRSIGIPAALDYIPFYADSNFTGYFVTYLNQSGRFEPLPHKDLPILTAPANRIPKIYRRTFLDLDDGLFALKEISKTTPPLLGHFHYLDVTADYLPVRTIVFEGESPDTLIYLTVKNDSSQKAVDWAIIQNGSATFSNIGPVPATGFGFMPDDTLIPWKNVNSQLD